MTSQGYKVFAGRRSTALIQCCGSSVPRTRPNHARGQQAFRVLPASRRALRLTGWAGLHESYLDKDYTNNRAKRLMIKS
jgi:hypothetical protein